MTNPLSEVLGVGIMSGNVVNLHVKDVEAAKRVRDYISSLVASSVEPEVVQDVERWKRELKAAGWAEKRFDLWRSPGGLLYRGPYKAWQVMMGHV